MMQEEGGRWIVGVTGASGAPYALRLIGVLSAACESVDLVISEAGLRVFAEEEDLRASQATFIDQLVDRGVVADTDRSRLTLHHPKDIGASIASGSARRDGMVVVPCSMGTLGAIARGVPQNLLHRAAEVTMKERRQLILVPRETPLSAIHLENMLALARLGVGIVPAMPGFYTRPGSIGELVDMQVMKILDLMGVPHAVGKRWKDSAPASPADAG
jgi:flavin prenyltransferase